VRPHGGTAGLQIRDAFLFLARQSHHVKLTHAVAQGTERQPLAVGRGLLMVVQRTGRRIRQPLVLAIECSAEQFHAASDLACVEDGPSIDRPDRHIAAAAVKVGNVEERDHSLVSQPVRDLPQPRSVRTHHMGMAVVMLSRKKQEPGTVGRPLGREIERDGPS
jgi:hypothetical protein